MPGQNQEIPQFIRRNSPKAEYAFWNDGHLLVRVGETSLMLTPDDIRDLKNFMGKFDKKKAPS